ncbi:MAG: S8 family serine peptidase, partial [Chloroflexi bacterium]|nr:S8 family serine peptidase [Chloroflexota bacterium]
MHKAFVYVDSTDEAGQAAVAAGVTEVLAVYGVRVLVRATEEQLQALEEAGFQVELADEMDRLTLPSVIIDTTAEPTRAAAPPPPGWRTRAAPDEPSYWLVQFVGPPQPEWIEAVRDAGADIIGPMPENAILVRMTQPQADAVAQLEHVQWVGPYEPLYKIHPELIGEEGPLPATEASRLAEVGGAETRATAERVALRITLFEPEALSAIVSEIESAGGTIEKADIDTIICELPRSAIPTIAALPAVAQIEPYAPPVLEMDVARTITLVQTNFDLHGLDGEGETVGVADTGLDRGVDNPTLHQDFKKLNGDNGRVVGRPLGRPGRWDDPDGHGTHVSGIAVGNGRARGTNRPQSGVAYKGNLVIQSLLDASGGLGGIPGNLNSLFDPAYTDDGVRVHSNSWGSKTSLSQYLAEARQIDEFTWRNPDMIIVRSAGNYGVDNKNLAGATTPDGIVDFYTINPQSTCRNGISVGASENNKPSISRTYGSWATDFPVDPLRSDRISNNPDHVVAFSSRGPTSAASGQRIKPDVLAPGCSILAPWSRLSSTSEFWGPRPNDGSPYIYEGGTSMAAPHVSGMCALIRQYLRMVHNLSDPHNADKRRRRPSAALIKALLIHGARRVQGLNAANAGPVPSNHQGWGRVDLRRSLFSHPIDAVASQDNGWLPRRTIFIDDPDIKLNSLPAADPNSRSRHEVRMRVANNSVPLRATLVWTDYPGPAGHPGTLVNHLRLSIIRHNADGTTTAFQVTPPAGLLPAGLSMLNNNVQQIDVSGADLQPGEYTIRVDAVNVASHAVAGEDQDFALVVSGPISHSDHRSPGTMHALPDLAFIDLAPAGEERHRHDGLAPSPERPLLDLGSPDIWASREANNDPAQAVDRVEAGQKHYVYIRVHNLGFADADDAQIQLYWADPATPMAYPADWKADGIQVSGAPGNQITTNIPARDNIVVGPFEWTPPSGHNYLVLFARAVHPEDPIVREGDVRWDNNITRRDVYLQDNATEVQGEPSGWDKF